jgi:hypothetical protein
MTNNYNSINKIKPNLYNLNITHNINFIIGYVFLTVNTPYIDGKKCLTDNEPQRDTEISICH